MKLIALIQALLAVLLKKREAPARTPDPTEPLCTENLSTHILPRSVYPREEG